jgi:VWFA-related protein
MPSRWPACALLAALLIAGATAQEPQPTFRIEANYVRVDVYPTANGAPIADLVREDFEIFENNVPQAIDAFEHVQVAGLVPQELRREPASIAESRAMLENPRARVFVLFLDYYHVDAAGSRNMRTSLAGALDRFLGPDDLFAVMTPEMSALDLSFARKTTTVRGMLEKHWIWGERDQLISPDPQDEQYRQCFGSSPDIAEEMIERRREKLVLDALQDLVRHLRGAREERKAILTISNGWQLFQRNDRLMRQVGNMAPGTPPRVGVDPRTGRLTTENTTSRGSVTQYACDRDRMNLAQIDNAQQFRDIVEDANRGNAAFYPIDPRGLAVFDEPIMRVGRSAAAAPPLPPSVDRARLSARLETLRVMAVDTDGLAIVQTNDLEGGFKRIIADLSSYYLLGYYSNRTMDGRFHQIRVRVKRPGAQVRARRGYLAPTAAAVTAAANRARADAASPLDPAALEARAVESALAPLNSLARDRPVRLHAVAGWRPDKTAAVWAVGEMSVAPAWKAGADVDVLLIGAAGETVETRHAQVAAGTRAFAVSLAPAVPLQPGEYTVTVRARGRGVDPLPTTVSIVVSLRPAPVASSAVLVRRGPTTGNRDTRTADVRFRRTEQVRVEIPTTAPEPGIARLLDRTGKPLPVPVTAGLRDDPDGSRWRTAHLTLAPLAPGDYVIELAGGAGGERTLVAFRVVP